MFLSRLVTTCGFWSTTGHAFTVLPIFAERGDLFIFPFCNCGGRGAGNDWWGRHAKSGWGRVVRLLFHGVCNACHHFTICFHGGNYLSKYCTLCVAIFVGHDCTFVR